MKHYTHIYNSYEGEKKLLNERVLQKVTINGKELKDKNIEVTKREDQVNYNHKTKAGQFATSIDITISDDGDKKKKKEEDLKEFKFQCKRNLMYEIAKLLRRIGDYAEEIEVQEFTARNILMPLESDKTYGITVDKEKHQALMINRLFDGFEEIDGMKGKDLPKVESILKKVRDGIDAFHFGTPPKEECIHPQQKEDIKKILKEDFKYKCEVKARQMGKTQEMENCIFSGIDFGKGPDVIHCLKAWMKDGKPYIEEI